MLYVDHMQPPANGDELDDVDAAVAAARRDFIDAFASRCDRMAALIDSGAVAGSTAAASELVHVLHRMGGLAGTVGLPTVTTRAREFEDMVRDAPHARVDIREAHRQLDALRAAFHDDISR
jgi:HPt (histidine-containing phosphotransfer) domain-containing protein